MEDIEDRLAKAQERISNSVLAIGSFLAGKAADAAEQAAELVEKTAKSITGQDPATVAAELKSKAKSKTGEPAANDGETSGAETQH
jgi:hypothetical protein